MQKTATTHNKNVTNSNANNAGPNFHLNDYLSLASTIILFLGSLNLGLIGVLDYDAVNNLLSSTGVRVFYILVGVSSLTLIPSIYRMLFRKMAY